MESPMQGSKSRSVDIADCDEQTFIRFSQYAYTGDYVAATSEILLSSFDIDTANIGDTDGNGKGTADTKIGDSLARVSFAPAPEEVIPAPDEVARAPEAVIPIPDIQENWGMGHALASESLWNSSYTSRTPTKKSSKKTKVSVMTEPVEACTQKCVRHCVKLYPAAKIRQTFVDRHYSITSPIFKAQGNSEACENFTEVFLCHARLFVFADKYLITALTGLCLHKLHQTLIEFHFYDERAGDVVELLRYAYSGEGWGDLQALVVHYAACVIRKLQKNEDFIALLGERSSLSAHLIDRLLSDGCPSF